MALVSPISRCLWSDRDALEAAEFSSAILPDSRVLDARRFTGTTPDPAGAVPFVDFLLNGQRFQAINGGALFRFDGAVSFVVECRDQQVIDRRRDALPEGGGTPVQCGWLRDRFGPCWHIVPSGFAEMMRGPEPRRAAQAMAARYAMVKFDGAGLQAAYDAG